MISERIVSEYRQGATIDGISKTMMQEENQERQISKKQKDTVKKITYKECRYRVEEVILKEIWNKLLESEVSK